MALYDPCDDDLIDDIPVDLALSEWTIKARLTRV
jgi:hypothetical protein